MILSMEFSTTKTRYGRKVADSCTYLLARDTDQRSTLMVDLGDTLLNAESTSSCESTTGGIR